MYNINVLSKNVPNIDYVICKRTFILVCAERREVVKYSNLIHNANPSQLDLYHVAIPTDVSLLSLSNRRQSHAAGLQRMTKLDKAQWCIYTIYDLQNCGFKIFYLMRGAA